MKIIFLLIGLLCWTSSFSQSCFVNFYERGKLLYEERKYETARKQFDAAKACDDKPEENDLDEWIEKCRQGDAALLEEQRKLKEEKEQQAEKERLRAERLADSLKKVSIRKSKEDLYNDLSQDLTLYVDKLKDLRDFLPYIQNATLSPNAFELLEKTTKAYNEAREKILGSRREHVRNVAEYWESEELSQELDAVYSQALDNIHDGIILTLNQKAIEPVRNAFLGKTSRLSAQRKAKKNGKKAFNELDRPIRQLEEMTKEILDKLK